MFEVIVALYVGRSTESVVVYSLSVAVSTEDAGEQHIKFEVLVAECIAEAHAEVFFLVSQDGTVVGCNFTVFATVQVGKLHVTRFCTVGCDVFGVIFLYDADIFVAIDGTQRFAQEERVRNIILSVTVEFLQLVAVHIESQCGTPVEVLCLDVGGIQVDFDTPVVYASHGSFHTGQTVDHYRDVTVKYLIGSLGEVSIEFQADTVVEYTQVEAIVE